MKNLLLLILLSTMTILNSNGQSQTIRLTNPSFEDFPHSGRQGYSPKGWLDCGAVNFPTQTPPDIQPSFFEVSLPAKDGQTYLGLVVRDDDTWESVSQRLLSPLKANHCYEISLYLARSADYISGRGDRNSKSPDKSQYTLNTINHNRPITLRIWGGNDYCDKKENFIVSDEITHTNWVKYSFKLKPKTRITHITFEAFYTTPILFPYNGNILIDKISDIVEIDCDKEISKTPYVQITKPFEKKTTVDEELFHLEANVGNLEEKSVFVIVCNNQLVEDFSVENGKLIANFRLFKGKNKVSVTVKNKVEQATDKVEITYNIPNYVADVVKEEPKTTPIVTTTPTPKPKQTTINHIDKKKLKKGTTIKIDKLYFNSNSYKIEASSYPALDEIYEFMKDNPDVYIEIGGHTNGIPSHEFCDKLSSLRAKAVAKYLINKGIPAERLRYKGYGKRKPVASNKTKEGRKKNQRVEIKILKIG